MPDTVPQRARKLPFWRTIGRSYYAVVEHFGDYLKSLWPWALVIFAIGFAVYWFTWDIAGPFFKKIKSGDVAPGQITQSELLSMSALGLGIALIMAPIMSSLAVAWHRMIIRDEKIASAFYLRLDRVVWSYALVLAVLMMLTQIPSLFAGFGATPELSSTTLIFSIAYFVLIWVVLFLWARLSVYLPSIAVEKQDISMSDVWDRTKNNTLRLFFGWFICALPIMVASQIHLYIIGDGRLGMTMGLAIAGVISMILAFPSIVFLSHAFQHFFLSQDKDPQIPSHSGV